MTRTEFRNAHGDPATWTTSDFEFYLDLPDPWTPPADIARKVAAQHLAEATTVDDADHRAVLASHTTLLTCLAWLLDALDAEEARP